MRGEAALTVRRACGRCAAPHGRRAGTSEARARPEARGARGRQEERREARGAQPWVWGPDEGVAALVATNRQNQG